MSETVQGGQARGDSRKAPRAGRFQSTSLDDFVFGGGGATESVDGDADGPAAEPMLDVPDVRQRENFDCGPAAVMSVCRYFDAGPSEYAEYVSGLGTTPEDGTPPGAIVEFLDSVGLEVHAKTGMTLEELASHIAAGRPVIVCCQDWGTEREKESLDSGHWITVVGVSNNIIYAQDPSASNVDAGDHPPAEPYGDSIPGKVMIDAETFLDKWWRDKDGSRVYQQLGIAVGPGRSGTAPEKQ